MNIGDIISFQQQYGMPYLCLKDGLYTWTYARHRVQGGVQSIVTSTTFGDVLFVKLQDAGEYGGLVGIPASKATLEQVGGKA